MNSRINDDVRELFVCFCEVAQSDEPDKDGWIIQKFPDSYDDKNVLNALPKFVYPCTFDVATVQHFSFVLTNLESKWKFGFCRHDPKTSTALAMLSDLPWHEVFARVLNTAADLIRTCEAPHLTEFLHFLHRADVPDPGQTVTHRLPDKLGSFHYTAPPQFGLPTIPESRNLTEYYNAVDASNMITVLACMLHERRIVMKSRKLTRLSACVQAVNTLIYPMSWQHLFIPLLPRQLTDYLLAPMPYLIGVPTNTWEAVRSPDIGDVVVLDLDNGTNQLESRFNDEDKLPPEVTRFLKTQLRDQAAMREDGLARAFLRALVRIIGGYRDALRFQQGEKITFNAEAFVESRPTSMQPFLREMLNTQIFRQFIEERLDILNAGLGFSDDFEFEANSYTAKSHSAINEQYNHWVTHMKKHGTAFFKTVKNKTNPAMKSAVRRVKESGKDVKSAYKDIKTRIRKDGGHSNAQHGEASNSTFHRARPLTIGNPISSNSTYTKPRGMSSVVTASSRSNEYVPLSSPADDITSPALADSRPVTSSSPRPATAASSEMNLMADLEQMLNQKCSLLDASPPVDRTLKPLSISSSPPRVAVTSEDPPPPLPPARHSPLTRTSWSLPLETPSPGPVLCVPHPDNPFSFSFGPRTPLTDPFGFMPFETISTNPAYSSNPTIPGASLYDKMLNPQSDSLANTMLNTQGKTDATLYSHNLSSAILNSHGDRLFTPRPLGSHLSPSLPNSSLANCADMPENVQTFQSNNLKSVSDKMKDLMFESNAVTYFNSAVKTNGPTFQSSTVKFYTAETNQPIFMTDAPASNVNPTNVIDNISIDLMSDMPLDAGSNNNEKDYSVNNSTSKVAVTASNPPINFATHPSNPFSSNNETVPAFETPTVNRASPAAVSASQYNGTGDLIRLDSTSSHNDNSISRESSDDSIVFRTGITNPLYPFTTPLSFNADHADSVTAAPAPVRNNTSFVHRNPRASSLLNEKDMDLLKEYGIDFSSSAKNNNVEKPSQPVDAFDMFENGTHNTPGTWTTFD